MLPIECGQFAQPVYELATDYTERARNLTFDLRRMRVFIFEKRPFLEDYGRKP